MLEPAPSSEGDDNARQGSSLVADCSMGAQAAVARSPGLSRAGRALAAPNRDHTMISRTAAAARWLRLVAWP
jgi:hypothetical protein